MIKAILFDVIGTTVQENKGDIVLDSLYNAFLSHRINVAPDDVSKYRGMDKRQMILELLLQQASPPDLVEPIYEAFKKNIANNLSHFSEMADAPAIFRFVQQTGIKLGIGTGLPKDLFLSIYKHLEWESYQFDYIGISEELGKSRPDPVMVLDMIQRFGIEPGAFLKVGDTVADIQEGKKAGVKTAVILSGTQHKNDLLDQKPDFVISSLLELKAIISSKS